MRLILAMIMPVKQSKLLNKEKISDSQEKASPTSSIRQSTQIDTQSINKPALRKAGTYINVIEEDLVYEQVRK